MMKEPVMCPMKGNPLPDRGSSATSPHREEGRGALAAGASATGDFTVYRPISLLQGSSLASCSDEQKAHVQHFWLLSHPGTGFHHESDFSSIYWLLFIFPNSLCFE